MQAGKTKKVFQESAEMSESLGFTEDELNKMMTKSSLSETSVFQSFKRNIYCDGTIAWRKDNNTKQVVVMNDYHSENGNFKVFLYTVREEFYENVGNFNYIQNVLRNQTARKTKTKRIFQIGRGKVHREVSTTLARVLFS
jgi:hypothetical protein